MIPNSSTSASVTRSGRISTFAAHDDEYVNHDFLILSDGESFAGNLSDEEYASGDAGSNAVIILRNYGKRLLLLTVVLGPRNFSSPSDSAIQTHPSLPMQGL